jgi:glucokinase
VGLGLPGPIDFEKGIVHFFPNIPGWKEVKLKNILEKRLKLPVFVDNDAKVMALAEYKLGAARGSTNAVCITLGTGVGGGIIINGKLYRGLSNVAGEIGHMPINENGPACNCGGKACLEAYIGNNRVLAEARRVFGKGITLEKLSYLAKKQNRQAKIIWLRFAERLSVALSGVVNLLNPDCIVIGGGVAAAGNVLFNSIKKAVRLRAMSVQVKHVKILGAKLKNNAGLIGAAILVKQAMAKDF